MAVDRYTIEYHLTDGGWVSGSTTYFRNKDRHVDLPENTHETWEYESSQASGWSREETRWSRIWTNPSSDPDHIAALHKKFPAPKG